MKISTYIFISFIFILLMFSITTFINFRLSDAIRKNADYLANSTEIIRKSARFQRNSLNLVSGLRGYLLTGEKSFIASYDAAASENETILKELHSIINDSVQNELLKDIVALNYQWIEGYADPLREAKMAANVSDSNLTAYNRLYREKFLKGNETEIQSKIQSKFREFGNLEYKHRDERKIILANSAMATQKTSFILMLLSLVTGFVIVIFLIKRISKRIRSMVTMADTIASGHYEVTMPESGKDELNALEVSLNHMARELSSNIALLKARNDELDQFAHIVSHDLKGPLRGIDNVVTWIEEDHKEELTPRVDEYLQIIKGRVKRGENLIQGILSYARTGRETLPKEEVRIDELIQEVLDSNPSSGITLQIQKDMPTLYTEKLPLFQVFSNLIGNAIKYIDKEEGTVNIYFKDHGGFYEFFVEDNGPGIAEAYHKRIMVIFQTLNDRDSFESTGVGLAIVKKILDGRKESIHINSESGKGSVFSFTWSKT